MDEGIAFAHFITLSHAVLHFLQNDLELNDTYNQFVSHSSSGSHVSAWDMYSPSRP